MIVTGHFKVVVKESREAIHSKKAGMVWPSMNAKKRGQTKAS